MTIKNIHSTTDTLFVGEETFDQKVAMELTPELDKIWNVYQDKVDECEALKAQLNNAWARQSEIEGTVEIYRALHNNENSILFARTALFHTIFSPVLTVNALQKGEELDQEFQALKASIPILLKKLTTTRIERDFALDKIKH